MDRVAAMLILLGVLVSTIILLLAVFAFSPIFCSCVLSLFYTLYLFMAHENHGIHHAQEFENRFWTIFAVLFSTALFFAKDSPLGIGVWSPSLGFGAVLLAGYAMHTWDRMVHRRDLSRQVSLRRTGTAQSSLIRLKDLGIPVEEQFKRINECLDDIDQLLIPSTINNFINQRFVMSKEREVIAIFEECDARALNYLVSHVKLGLLFYKIKDHRNYASQHRTEIIQLLAVDRLPILTVMSRVIVLHALQLMKLRANPKAEYWVRNVILNTHYDDLSELKTLTDAKGDYFCMNKLIYDDIRSETTRQDILKHLQKEATLQQHYGHGVRKRPMQSWRKVLSDVDDTLCSSGGSYPAGIDKRYMKKVVYPGVLAFYREMDLGIHGPEQWPKDKIGNLVFLSARPHVYKDVSEKINFAKFERLRAVKADGRQGLHTTPSLLAGDIASGTEYMMTNDMEPLALKKFDNFKRYVSIYPEYNHVFVCDNGQGDVRAGELMFDAFPYEFEALYVHVVQEVTKTHGYAQDRWLEKGFRPCFFRTYPEAALDAATKRDPPLIRLSGLRRVCQEAVQDFYAIEPKQWQSKKQKADRRQELNQSLWETNNYLTFMGEDRVPLVEAERLWMNGEKVRTPFGVGRIRDFDPVYDLYEVALDWRPLSQQVEDHVAEEKLKKGMKRSQSTEKILETVVETDNEHEEEDQNKNVRKSESSPPRLALEPNDLTPPDKRPEKVLRGSSSQSLSSVDTLIDEEDDRFCVKAKIQGRNITKYTPPVLPKLKKDAGESLFTFWATSPKSDSGQMLRKRTFKVGEQCRTPYGVGTIEDYRETDKVVVLKMEGWVARAYLNEEIVLPVSKSLLESFFGQFGSAETASKQLEFPHAEGTVLKTPFGDGKVVRPLKMAAKDVTDGTIGISITSWTLANDSHPTIYCTVETAKRWKENKGKDRSSSDGLLSVFGNLVSKTFLAPRPAVPVSEKDQLAIPKFTQYYKDGAAVSTDFGAGVIESFRPLDGFYEVSLVEWKLANGSLAKAILQKDAISHRVAKGCIEGYPVLTSMGLSGTLASVDPTTGVHIVTIPSAGMVCYLQPSCVVRPLKAAVGEDVLTAYGDGKLVRYYEPPQDTYEIKLVGWSATLYAKAETFDRAESGGLRTQDSLFGMNWLFNMLFFTSQTDAAETTAVSRSRSNSFVSQSVKSASVRSVTK